MWAAASKSASGGVGETHDFGDAEGEATHTGKLWDSPTLQPVARHGRDPERARYPQDRAAGLLALRAVAEAHGRLAAEAAISRESLYRALSLKGNPTLKTLVAVLKTLGLRLSVAPAHDEPA
jgi:probable addiction module antidote protein